MGLARHFRRLLWEGRGLPDVRSAGGRWRVAAPPWCGEDTHFEVPIKADVFNVVSEHVVFGEIVVPGVVYVESAMEAGPRCIRGAAGARSVGDLVIACISQPDCFRVVASSSAFGTKYRDVDRARPGRLNRVNSA